MAVADRSERGGKEFERILAEVFRKAGWRVHRPSIVRDRGADLFVNANGKKYAVQLRASSEGRRDRLIPLLSQAILQIQTFAQHSQDAGIPVAVVAAKRVSASVAEQIKQFAERYAPEVGVGVIDADGLRSFSGHGLEELDARPSRHAAGEIPSFQRPPDLFSDLNQWMLKILLGQHLPAPLISVPRVPIRNASQLAELANVSVMSATRFLNQLASRGFVDEGEERMKVVRVEELLDLWVSSNRDAAKEIPAHWIINKGVHQLRSAVRSYTAPHDSTPTIRPKKDVIKIVPRCCVGLFAAADILGIGFVHGVPPHIYLERVTLDSLGRLDLMVGHSHRPADVYIRIPINREAVFRASVTHDGVPTSDVLQVWLDVSTHPARGREQAREIRRRIIDPLFGKQQ